MFIPGIKLESSHKATLSAQYEEEIFDITKNTKIFCLMRL